MSQSKEKLDRMKILETQMASAMKQNGLNSEEMNNLMQTVEIRWNESMNILEEINSSPDQRGLERRTIEELSTLRDVHDGYNKYIQNADELSINDTQKLSMQLETNRVSLNFDFCFV